MARIDLFCRARPAERTLAVPGDEVIPRPPALWLNLAISVSAPRAAVWPWIAQMGAGRAGWYSYDVLDNGGRPSLRRIDPNLQEIAVGDLFPALPGATDAFILTDLDPGRALVLGVPGDDPIPQETGTDRWRSAFNRANWTWVLSDEPEGTRILTRARLARLELDLPLLGRRAMPFWVAKALAPPIHWIMGRRQLNRIQKLAEGKAGMGT